MPAVFASAMITFAASLDDFVVSNFLYGSSEAITVPVKLYSAVKAAPSPALERARDLAAGGHAARVAADLPGVAQAAPW